MMKLDLQMFAETLIVSDAYDVEPIGRYTSGGRFNMALYLVSQSGNTSTLRFHVTQEVLNGYNYEGFPAIHVYGRVTTNNSSDPNYVHYWDVDASTCYYSSGGTTRINDTFVVQHKSDGTLSVTIEWWNRDSSNYSSQTYYYVPENGSKTRSDIAIPTTQVEISYNSNGGNTPPASQWVTPGSSLTLTSTKPTRDNLDPLGRVTYNANGGSCSRSGDTDLGDWTSYAFYKWNSKADGTGTSYNSGGTYTFNDTTVLYAQWTATTHRNTVTLPTANECTRTHYTLLGWSTSSSATTATYAPGATYYNNTSKILYAVWTPTPQYTVSYNANGGTGAPSSQTFYAGESVTLSNTRPTKASDSVTRTCNYNANGGSSTKTSETKSATRTYTFSAWIYNGNSYAPGGTYTFSGNTQLTADYTNAVADVQFTTPTAVECTRTHYTLLGWGTSASSTTVVYTPGQTFTSAGTTLYAIWQENPKYTATFDANGGSGAPSSIEFYQEDGLTIPNTIPTKVNTNANNVVHFDANGGTTTVSQAAWANTKSYAFESWINSGSSDKYYPNTHYNPTGNLTLVANYTETITAITTPITPTTAQCTMQGKVLVGWLDQTTGVVTFPGSPFRTQSMDSSYSPTLLAVWSDVPTPTTGIAVYVKTASGWELVE